MHRSAGCLSEGETLEETVDNISEAIIGCLKSRLKLAGGEIPGIKQVVLLSG